MNDSSDIILGPDGEAAPKPEYTGMKLDAGFVFRHAEHRVPALKKMHKKIRAIPVPVGDVVKVGRNDPCPCESGKKFKHCHWKHIEGKKT